LRFAKGLLLERGHAATELDALEAQVNQQLEVATQCARDAQWPLAEAAFSDVADCAEGVWF
jgi:TPP-dependent pyruvate/acetoin dehydrogenase alpha subunit